MEANLISVIVPLYNEEEFILEILRRVVAAPLPEGCRLEVIVVDDGSNDGSAELVEGFSIRHQNIRLIRHGRNRGKGAAIRTALEAARGSFTLIQDADLEYDPREYGKLLRPLLEDEADAVLGSRFLASGERRVLYFWHSLANRVLCTVCNVAADLNVTDVSTCYKAARTSLLQSIPLRSDRFSIEPELIIKLAKRDARLYEVPISYHGRTYEEGKKIRLFDGLKMLGTILRCWLWSDIYKERGPEILDAFSDAGHFNRWMATTIAPYVSDTILEIGAGMGNLTRALIPRRKRYIATDIDREHLARLASRLRHRPNLEVRTADLEKASDFDALENSVRTVVCLNVVEHVKDDLLAARNIYRALQPGGAAVVLVPQGQWAYGKIDEALGHYKRYSAAELTQVLEKAGFQVEKMISFNRISLPGWYLNGKVLGRTTISPFQLRTFDKLVWLWRRIDGFLPWGPTSIIAIARKPSA